MSSVWFHGSAKTFWPTTVMNTMSVMVLKQKTFKSVKISAIRRLNQSQERRNLLGEQRWQGNQLISMRCETLLKVWRPGLRWKFANYLLQHWFFFTENSLSDFKKPFFISTIIIMWIFFYFYHSCSLWISRFLSEKMDPECATGEDGSINLVHRHITGRGL